MYPIVNPQDTEPVMFELQDPLALIVGNLSVAPPPYERILSVSTDRRIVSKAKGMAPRRYCRSCGNRLRTRAVVSYDDNNRVYIQSIAYGHDDNGYWCSQKCIDRWNFN